MQKNVEQNKRIKALELAMADVNAKLRDIQRVVAVCLTPDVGDEINSFLRLTFGHQTPMQIVSFANNQFSLNWLDTAVRGKWKSKIQ